MALDPSILNIICLLRGKKRVRLHWHKAGSYWSESWDAQHLPGDSVGKPPKLGYTLEEVTYEEHM